MSAKDRIRDFLEKNVGKVVTTEKIGEVAGISEYGRRVRELRDKEGMEIRTHFDRHDLMPGQYILETLNRRPVIGSSISPQLRTRILERNGYTCQACGAGSADTDPFNPSRKVRLHVDHIIPDSQGGETSEENLRVLCSACNQGRSNIQVPSETALNLLARLRRTSRSVRREVYVHLKREFGD